MSPLPLPNLFQRIGVCCLLLPLILFSQVKIDEKVEIQPNVLTSKIEQALVGAGSVPDIDVYHASHHGAKTGNSEELVEALEPEVSIVSRGTTYNHPNKTVIERLRDNESVICQTNKNTRKWKGPEPIKNVAAGRIGDINPLTDMGSILIFVKDGKYTVSLERKGYKDGDSSDVQIIQ